VRRAPLAALALAAALVVAAPVPALAGFPAADVVVVRVDGVDLARLLSVPEVRAVSELGGAALLSRPSDVGEQLEVASRQRGLRVGVEDLRDGATEDQLARLGDTLARAATAAPGAQAQIWVISDGSGVAGDDLGAVVMEIPTWEPAAGAGALTSDSTRRDGVVVAADILPTMCAGAFVTCAEDVGGAEMRPADAPPPLALYDRYLANRRMTVPIQTAAGLFVTFAGMLGVALLALRRRVPARLSSAGAWIAISVVPLALALLLAGHLSTPTYASVLAVVIGGTLVGTLAFVPVARARGTVSVLGWMGAATLALLLLEAALGWTGALHTFFGGTELDGGRFYGLPNVDIGLLLGASVYVAYRLPDIRSGVALILGVALFAGLPFAGANLGAAVTLAATAGLWYGLRGRRGALSTLVAMLVAAAAGLMVTLVLNRFLPGPATHITSFVEGERSSVFSTVVHRIGTGSRLIARNPFAIVPVIGVPVMLLAVLRPPAPVAASFAQHPCLREALLTMLLGSVVAYAANDTGAAALGLGLGTALGAMLFVSLRDRPWMMEAT
jgi:hypothetical protein